jgi:hypothetical protein
MNDGKVDAEQAGRVSRARIVRADPRWKKLKRPMAAA